MNRHITESLKNRFIFVAIPKTATNSIWNNILTDKSFQPFQHNKASTIRKQISTEEWNKRFSFTCVRHPYTLVKSWYNFHKTHANIGNDVKDFYPDDFEQWVMSGFPTHWEWDSYKRLNTFWDGSNPLHQYEWVTDDDKNIIVDCIMKYETLSDDFKTVADKFGFNDNLKHLNTSKNHFKLNDKIKEKIYTTFKTDFRIFNYEIDFIA